MIAITFGVMRLIPNVGAAAIVIPTWCSAAGCLLGGYRGATRGLILSILYPIYFAVIIAGAALVFWIYALLHRVIAGEQIIW